MANFPGQSLAAPAAASNLAAELLPWLRLRWLQLCGLALLLVFLLRRPEAWVRGRAFMRAGRSISSSRVD
jgi:hypothetical protein